MDRKINNETLESRIGAMEGKILVKINQTLDEDGMKRVKLSNDLKMSITNTEDAMKDKYASIERALQDLL